MLSVLDLLALKTVLNTQGVYPAATVRDGARTERTEWQEGWNAAHLKLCKDWNKATMYLKSLPEDIRPVVESLLLENALGMYIQSDVITFYVNMNDTFCFACADDEEVEIDELLTVHYAWNKFGHDGLTAWASKKREELPLEQLQTDKYFEAVEFLKQ